jgi:hypothetical protein
VSKKSRDHMDPVDADLVWSAACAAYRINGGYFKEPKTIGDQVIRHANRAVVRQALDNPSLINDADHELARNCRQHLATSVTMQALRSELGEWARITARVCGLDTVDSMYDFSVITAMPHSYAKTLRKESVDSRLARCDGLTEKLGDKVKLAVEIVRNNYSAKYNTWFVSAVTEDNRAVYFAYREEVPPETLATIRGTIKRHTDRSTQLNRVKLQPQEVVA